MSGTLLTSCGHSLANPVHNQNRFLGQFGTQEHSWSIHLPKAGLAATVLLLTDIWRRAGFGKYYLLLKYYLSSKMLGDRCTLAARLPDVASVFIVTCTSMSFTAIFIKKQLHQELFCLLAVTWTQNFQGEEQIPGWHPLVCAAGLDQTVQVCHVDRLKKVL